MSAAAARPPLLSVRGLCVEYRTTEGATRAVDNVSFEVHHDEILGLAGESGSGKSTAAMAVLRILQAPAVITGGHVEFEGRDVLAMDEAGLRCFRWREVALVFQSAMNALNPVLTIGEQIVDVIRAHEGLGRQSALHRACELLELVGIERGRVNAYPHELSGGMRQRVVIAVALALRPKLLVMDEPTTALDVVVQKEILQKIAELKRELGFSILFITHDLGVMLEFCDRIAVLYAGRVCEVGPAAEIHAQPRHPYTRGLLGAFVDMSTPLSRMPSIPGHPPDMRQPPPGCRFHPRCPNVIETCSRTVPPLLRLGREHAAACFVAHGQTENTSDDEQTSDHADVQRDTHPDGLARATITPEER